MDDEPGLLDHEATIDRLEEELARTVRLAEATPAELPIPTCPGWSASDLWEHLGTVHRWVTEILHTRPTERISRRTLDVHAPTDGLWSPWMAEGADELLGALRATSADDPMWTWGRDHHARWWARRQLHETVVHDADAALAMGEAFDTPPIVAADGISELLDNAAVRMQWPGATPPGRDMTLHLHATDPPDPEDPGGGAAGLGDHGEWMVSLGPGTITWTHDHGKGDVAVRGPVNTLMLMVNRRADPGAEELEVFGDTELLTEALTALSLP